jgi:hypothetical protein
MPLDSAGAGTIQDICDAVAVLLEKVLDFLPSGREEALMRKFMPRSELGRLQESRLLTMVADAMRLTSDLLLSQPSMTGSTAFDRMARSYRPATPAEADALAALRSSKYRLLTLQSSQPRGRVTVHDARSGETLRIAGTRLPPLPAGTPLFARVAKLNDDTFCFAGSITPLDHDALALAATHPSASHPAASANSRWAEAVYAHVVRNGTMKVPGLNRPSDTGDANDGAPEGCDPFHQVVDDWVALRGAQPDADLLRRTRELISLPTMVQTLSSTAREKSARGDKAAADAFERLLLVQMETLLRRERSGSCGLTLDSVAEAIEAGVARMRISPAVRDLFRSLRNRLAGSSAAMAPDDPALARLMQRIQGLRAKTVEHGCTEQEALAAAEKIAELLDRYGLSLGELDFRTQPCDGVGIETTRKRAAPIDSCMTAIAAFFDCRVWIESARGEPLRYIFFGVRADVAAAQYLYELVDRAFDTETARFRAGPIYAAMEGERRTATNSFQIGMARGIREKLAALRASRTARTSNGRDLVPIKAALVEEELSKLGLQLTARTTGSRSKRVLHDAYAAGTEAGARFEYSPGIGMAAE